jgi:hypothetical protein
MVTVNTLKTKVQKNDVKMHFTCQEHCQKPKK